MRGNRAAGYYRVSTARDGMKAPEIYQGQIKEYASFLKNEVVEVFEDIDYSGRKGAKERPGFTKMMAAAERGEFDIVIVPTLSRFGRNMRSNLAAYDRLEDLGIAMAIFDLRMDTTTSAGKLIRNMMTSMAEFESDQIADRWKATHKYLKHNGRSKGGGSTPFGYRYDPKLKNIVPEPAEAKVVKDIYKRYLRGQGCPVIRDHLEGSGAALPKGASRWWDSTVYRIISRASNAGLIEVDGELKVAAWKPLIERELWEQAQVLRRAARKSSKPPRQDTGQALLSGLLRCGVCGRNLHFNREAKYHRYRCSVCKGQVVGVSARRAESYVTEAFLAEVKKPYAEKATKARRKTFEPKKKTDDLEARLAEIEEQITALVNNQGLVTGEVARRAFQKKLDALEAQYQDVEGQQAASSAEKITTKRRIEDLDKLRKQLADLPRLWGKATTSERRELLGLAIDKVESIPETSPRELAITWNDDWKLSA